MSLAKEAAYKVAYDPNRAREAAAKMVPEDRERALNAIAKSLLNPRTVHARHQGQVRNLYAGLANVEPSKSIAGVAAGRTDPYWGVEHMRPKVDEPSTLDFIKNLLRGKAR